MQIKTFKLVQSQKQTAYTRYALESSLSIVIRIHHKKFNGVLASENSVWHNRTARRFVLTKSCCIEWSEVARFCMKDQKIHLSWCEIGKKSARWSETTENSKPAWLNATDCQQIPAKLCHVKLLQFRHCPRNIRCTKTHWCITLWITIRTKLHLNKPSAIVCK